MVSRARSTRQPETRRPGERPLDPGQARLALGPRLEPLAGALLEARAPVAAPRGQLVGAPSRRRDLGFDLGERAELRGVVPALRGGLRRGAREMMLGGRAACARRAATSRAWE